MVLNYRQIFRVLASAFVILAASMVIPLAVSLYCNETASIPAFLISIIVLLAIGFTILAKGKPSIPELRIRDGIFTVALCWLLIPLACTFPFLISGAIPNFADAFFECVSGFTTTGASILTEVEHFPKGLLLWRSFSQWLGGLGVLAFTIVLLPSLGLSGFAIVKADSAAHTMDKLTLKASDPAKMLYIMYIGMTFAQILLLCMGGMSLFDSVIHTLGSVSTGGFSNYSNSAAHFGSTYINFVTCLFMTMAGVNFTLYYYLFRRRWKKFFMDVELRAYLFIILGAVLFSTIALRIWDTYDTVGSSLNHALFQIVSIITTTGFATADTNVWPTTCKIILLTLMITGGCAASASGGIKIIRVVTLFKLIRRGIYKRLHPNAVVPIKLGDKALPADTVSAIANYLFLYVTVFLIGSLLVCLSGADPVTSVSASLACLSNIGPGFELVGSMANYAFFPDWTKIFLALIMIAGRLELFTFLMLLVPSFWNPDR